MTLDGKIEQLCDQLALLGHPVFLRIGYEFNGKAWNGYGPSQYRRAFIRVSEAIRKRNLHVALVWCAAAAKETLDNYMDFYPGDEYVDW